MQLIKNRIMLAKVEVTPGTDSTPVVGTDFILVKNLKRGYAGAVLDRDTIHGDLSPDAPLNAQQMVNVSFDVEMKGSGSVGVAGQLSALLQACAFTETVSAGSSCIYLPASAESAKKTMTIYIYNLDSGSCRLEKITGCVGDLDIDITAGNVAIGSFKMQGMYNLPTDAALPSAPTDTSPVPPVIQNAAFTLNSVATLILKSLKISMGNSVAQRDDISSPYSLKPFVIAGRKPTGTADPESALVAAYDWWSDWINSTKRALSVVVGSTAGNTITITAPKVVVTGIDGGDRNGISTHDLKFQLGRNAGNDEIQIKIT